MSQPKKWAGIALLAGALVVAAGGTAYAASQQQAMILRWNGHTWSVGSSGTFTGSLAAAATFRGAAREWAAGGTGQGLILSHS